MIIVISSLDRTFVKEFLEGGILNVLLDVLDNKKLHIDYLVFIASCISQLCYLNEDIKNYKEMDLLIEKYL